MEKDLTLLGKRVLVLTTGKIIGYSNAHGLCVQIELPKEDFNEDRHVWMSSEEVSIIKDKSPKCAKCGKEHVRIYRPYGNFYRPLDNRCNDCLENDDGTYVPCVVGDDGQIWGYLSAPAKDCGSFYKLPEANPKKPIWDSYHDCFSNRLEKVINFKTTP